MKAQAFPRTMKRGLLAGRTFVTVKDYEDALRDAHRNGAPKARRGGYNRKSALPVATGTYRLELKMHSGTHMVIEGTITRDSDVTDTLLAALAKLPLS